MEGYKHIPDPCYKGLDHNSHHFLDIIGDMCCANWHAILTRHIHIKNRSCDLKNLIILLF